MEDSAKKELQIQAIREKRAGVSVELEALVKEKNKFQRKINNLNHSIKEKTMLIRNYSTAIGQIRDSEQRGKVSDHAIVRYLERYKDFNVEAIVNEILEHPDAKARDDGFVTTIYKNEEPSTVEAKKLIKLARLSLKKGTENG